MLALARNSHGLFDCWAGQQGLFSLFSHPSNLVTPCQHSSKLTAKGYRVGVQC